MTDKNEGALLKPNYAISQQILFVNCITKKVENNSQTILFG